MANNYSQATVSPDLPKRVISDLELELLNFAGIGYEGSDNDTYYFYAEEYFGGIDSGYFDEIDYDSLTVLDHLYFNHDGALRDDIEVAEIFQNILKRLPIEDYPHITIQGADTCDKMRVDNFGGFAFYITRTEVDSISTWGWLNSKTNPK